jgi:CubicO group peptidase (beta-lactamase class C family)
VVLHRGALVTEIYFGECDPHSRHTMMSCNKSMIGTLAECLIDDGTLDDGALVVDVLPELSGSACADATVRQVMDMVVGIAFTEDYLDQSSDVWPFLRSTGMIPTQSGDAEAIADCLPSILKADGTCQGG